MGHRYELRCGRYGPQEARSGAELLAPSIARPARRDSWRSCRRFTDDHGHMTRGARSCAVNNLVCCAVNFVTCVVNLMTYEYCELCCECERK
jgi:hypothetical protein